MKHPKENNWRYRCIKIYDLLIKQINMKPTQSANKFEFDVIPLNFPGDLEIVVHWFTVCQTSVLKHKKIN